MQLSLRALPPQAAALRPQSSASSIRMKQIFPSVFPASMPTCNGSRRRTPARSATSTSLRIRRNGNAPRLACATRSAPNVLRAANDVRYPMFCSVASMMLLRLASGYVLAVTFDLGAIGIWIAMVGDWLCRSLLFYFRFRGKRWLRLAPGVQAVAQQAK